jgi:maltooligosyltrehalose trehalohydrolase
MTPLVGATPLDGSTTRFVVWAPQHERVRLHLLGPDRIIDLQPGPDGYHSSTAECGVGARYRYVLSGREYADPASRSQPDGVHGPSEVVDLGTHEFADSDYRPRPVWDHVIYELHVGTFSAEGTFEAVIAELDDLAELGVSAIEIMPVAQFPGRRNWGYDGVFPFAVQNSYGGYTGLQQLVDACHARHLAVMLDVVYNHLGPEGNVLGDYGPYFTDRYATPWGKAVNFDGPGSDQVRGYFIQNAQQWLRDFHIDALRLDAVHEIIDRNATTFLRELARQTGELSGLLGSPRYLIAESADNDPRLVTPAEAGGIGLDAQWNDDFHHALHSALTGEQTGYYVDYGPVEDLARAMDGGFVYQGEYSRFRKRSHGASSTNVAPERFVIFAQNHDHIGNRPKSDRLVTMISAAQARLVAALVLLSPGIPLLFMGEEYGEPAPFPYFVDHGDPDLIEAVRKGRAEEFASLADEGQLFDPADESTFQAARIHRQLRREADHRSLCELTGELIALRRQNPALRRSERADARAHADKGVITLVRSSVLDTVTCLFNLTGETSTATLPPAGLAADGPQSQQCWHSLLGSGAKELPPGTAVELGPFEFAVYHLDTGCGPGAKGAAR